MLGYNIYVVTKTHQNVDFECKYWKQLRKLWEIYLSLVVGRGNICSPLLHNSQHMEQPQRKLRLKPNIKKAIAHLGTRTCSFCVCLVTCLCYSWASDVQCMCQTDAKCVHERGRNQITPFWIQVMFSVFRGPKYDDIRPNHTKNIKKLLSGYFLACPPKIHYSAPKCSAMYCSVNA